MRTRYLFILLAWLISAPARAELPDPVRAMIEAAIATGDATKVAAVADVAKATNPDDVAEINAMLSAFRAEQRELAAAQAAAEREEIRQAGLLQNWSGKGQIGASQSSGNTDSVGLTASLNLQRKGIDWTHKLLTTVDYQRTEGVTSREKILARYEPRFDVSDDLYVFGLAQYERNRFQGLSARYSASGGVGYQVLQGPEVRLSIQGGPAYRRTEFVGGMNEDQIAALLALDFDWRISDNVTLTQDTSATAQGGGSALVFVSSENTSLTAITGVELGITDRLTTRLSYQVDYESDPPAGAVSTDTITRFTLVYGF